MRVRTAFACRSVSCQTRSLLCVFAVRISIVSCVAVLHNPPGPAARKWTPRRRRGGTEPRRTRTAGSDVSTVVRVVFFLRPLLFRVGDVQLFGSRSRGGEPPPEFHPRIEGARPLTSNKSRAVDSYWGSSRSVFLLIVAN